MASKHLKTAEFETEVEAGKGVALIDFGQAGVVPAVCWVR